MVRWDSPCACTWGPAAWAAPQNSARLLYTSLLPKTYTVHPNDCVSFACCQEIGQKTHVFLRACWLYFLLVEILFPLFLCSIFFPQQPACRKCFRRWALHFGLDGGVMRDLCGNPSGGENERNMQLFISPGRIYAHCSEDKGRSVDWVWWWYLRL